MLTNVFIYIAVNTGVGVNTSELNKLLAGLWYKCMCYNVGPGASRKKDGGSNAGAVAGAVIGVIVVLIIVAIIVVIVIM